MLLIARRALSSSTVQPANIMRTHPSNLHAEYIKDFYSLSEDDQEYLFYRTYMIFSGSYSGYTFEKFKSIFNIIPGLYLKLVLLKERKFNTDVGFNFIKVDKVYLNDDDYSTQNLFIKNFYFFSVTHHFRGGDLARHLLDMSEFKIRGEYPDNNRVSYNHTGNSRIYEIMSDMTPLMIPGPNQMPNDGPEKLIKKIMKIHNSKVINQDNPYVVYIPLSLNGVDYKRYSEEKEFKSEARKYFITTTRLEYGHFLANLAIYNLIEGNTLNIKAGSYERINKSDIDLVDYSSKFN